MSRADADFGLTLGGAGAVTPAGWGLGPALEALERGRALPTAAALAASGPGRRVPDWREKPAWLRQPRLRRASAASRFAVAAALEALGRGAGEPMPRLGVIAVVMNAAVQYSGRFYGEVLADPATASPILFPETVFNAPGSHLCALLGADGPSATLVGDGTAQTASGLGLARLWLDEDEGLDGVLLVSMEEADGLTAAGLALLDPGRVAAEGAAALWLTRAGMPGPRLAELDEASVLDAAELEPVVARWHRRLVAGAMPGRLIRGGGTTLARERVLAGLDNGQTLRPLEVFGDLFAVNATLALALATAILRAGDEPALWVAEAGGWHGAFCARLERS